MPSASGFSQLPTSCWCGSRGTACRSLWELLGIAFFRMKRHTATPGFWYFYLVALNVCPDVSVKHLCCSHAFAIPLPQLP